MGILTISTGELVFATAGHTAPVILHGDKVEYLTVKPNLMLAGMPGMKYKDHNTKLALGDRIFVYTDGVTEATNAGNELFGDDRLILSMADKKDLSPKELLEAIRTDVNRFVGDAPQFDDITMLVLSLKVLPPKEPPADGDGDMEGAVVRVFDATDENMEAVNDFVHSMLPEGCSKEVLNKLDLAVEEVYINIAHYAYKPATGTVEIRCLLREQEGAAPRLVIRLKDRGVQFNPLAREDPDITLSAEERDIGGLGIFLTKKFMDKVTYSYTDGQNILTIEKTLA
jgi:sigma-B regulation protein RsbU (phosphoserine phosphatase)